MVINYSELKLDHIVEFTKDKTTFVVTRYNGGRMRIFLIFNDGTGNTYTRNGSDNWEHISRDDAEQIKAIVETADSNVPVYRINASHTN